MQINIQRENINPLGFLGRVTVPTGYRVDLGNNICNIIGDITTVGGIAGRLIGNVPGLAVAAALAVIGGVIRMQNHGRGVRVILRGPLPAGSFVPWVETIRR
jgi:hypothetical protein